MALILKLNLYLAAFERVSKVEYDIEEELGNFPSTRNDDRSVPAILSRFQDSHTSLKIDVRTAKLQFVRPPDDGFEPRDHRNPPCPISSWMAYFNLLRIMFGAGLLTIPLAVSQAGLPMGPILILAIGIILTHTHLTLLWCLNDISRQLRIPFIPYRYGFRLALLHGPPVFHYLGNAGPKIIASCMILSQLGICTVFVIFTADSLRDLMDWEYSEPAIFSLFLPYLFLQHFMKNLKVISYISMVGNCMNVIGLVIVFYHIFNDPRGQAMLIQIPHVIQMLYAVGLGYFNMSSIGVILTLEKNLKNPKIMNGICGVVTVGMIGPTIFAVIFGTLGTWAFGVMDENILRSLPYDEMSSMISIGLYLVAVAFAYPIQCFPAIQIIVDILEKHDPKVTPSISTAHIVRTLSRFLFVILSFLLAYLMPFQGPIVAFVGNLLTSVLSIAFPALMEICILYPDGYGKYNWILIKDLTLILIGICSCIFGVIFGIYLLSRRILGREYLLSFEYD